MCDKIFEGSNPCMDRGNMDINFHKATFEKQDPLTKIITLFYPNTDGPTTYSRTRGFHYGVDTPLKTKNTNFFGNSFSIR